MNEELSVAVESNFTLVFGEPPSHLAITFLVKKTWLARVQWWLFCKVFPCHIERWE